MNTMEKEASKDKSIKTIGLFVAFALVFVCAVKNYDHMKDIAVLKDAVAHVFNVTHEIRNTAAPFVQTERDPLMSDIHKSIKKGTSLEPYYGRAVNYLVENKCKHVASSNMMCEFGFADELWCLTLKKQISDCEFWTQAKNTILPPSNLTIKVALDEAYGIRHNGTHVLGIQGSTFGSGQYSMKLQEEITLMNKAFSKIVKHATHLIDYMENSLHYGFYTKSFDDFISFHSGGRLGASKVMYAALAIVGAPVPFVGYFVFCVLVEYNDFVPGRDIVTVEGLSTLADVFGAGKTWAACLRLFYIDLWNLLFIEIVAFIVCYYMEYFSPLYFVLKFFGKKIEAWMERHEDVHSVFSAFPAFFIGFLEAFRYMCYGIIMVSMALRMTVLMVVAIYTFAKMTVGFWIYGLGICSTVISHLRNRNNSYTLLVATTFIAIEWYVGVDLKKIGDSMPELLGEFSLKNWVILVPSLVANMTKELPSNARNGMLSLFGVVAMHFLKNITGGLVSENPAMSRIVNSGHALPRSFRAIYALNRIFSAIITTSKIAFWVVSLASPFIGQYVGAHTILGGIFNAEGWLFHAAKMFLLYLSQRA